jgi:hypothetical protein
MREAGASPDLIGLIQEMWAEDPGARPQFKEAAAMLEQERFWLKDVNAVEFRRYVDWLEREASRDREHLRTEWKRHLEKAGSALDMASSIQGETDVVGKFVKALGFVCEDQVAAEVQARVRKSIEERDSILYAVVNRGADLPLDFEPEDEMEDELES